MKYLFGILFWCLAFPLLAVPYGEDIQKLLARLDALIEQKETFIQQKETKIAQLCQQAVRVRTAEERYWMNKQLYDELFVYNADSAMVYVKQNLDIAAEMKREDWQAEWQIKKAFLLSATGLLKEALDVLEKIDGQQLPPDLQIEYYGQMMYLYSHFGLYSGLGNLSQGYYQKESMYKDSIYAVITPENPQYLWYKGWKFLGTADMDAVADELKRTVDVATQESRHDAMNAYILALLYRESGHTEAYLKYMIYSAMADVRTANRDIASLEEVAKTLFSLGDIDHAYTYINYCLQHAQWYRNRVRVVGISEIQDAIHAAYQERSRSQERRLQLFLVLVSILSVVLLLAIFYIGKQMKRLTRSRAALNRMNHLLNQHVDELSLAHDRLGEANGALQALNDRLQEVNLQLKEANSRLRESNYVKEEYIGYVFSLCSNYISKLDAFRKNLHRKLKANQFEEAQALTHTPTLAQNELKEFYHNFDAIFLHVYPDFVNDFNALLQPEERIVLKEGELLNTELRIYALVRLGINDSVKIAEFLHCSPQTVYNNRLKTRNKALIPKEEFTQTVRSLGKMQE